MTENERMVLSALPIGSDIKVSTVEIARQTRLSTRAIRYIIERLIIRYRIPIVASRLGGDNGYYIASNHDELLEGIKSYYNQANNMNKRITVLLNSDLEEWKKIAW